MKNWIHYINSKTLLLLFLSGFICSFLLSDFMFTIVFGSFFISWTIILSMDNETKNKPRKQEKHIGNTALHVSPIDDFLQKGKSNHTSIIFVLQHIKKSTVSLSTRWTEFDLLEQHELERMINKKLPELLSHYQDLSIKERMKYEDDLLESLVYIEETLTEVYLKKLDNLSIQAFKKTQDLLNK